MPSPNSYGLLYSSFTGYLGFRPFRQEGKLTGLAAHGCADAIDIPFPFSGKAPNRTFQYKYPLHSWLRSFDGQRLEDICAWLQQHLERKILSLINVSLVNSGTENLALV
jgi:carbamoyltransferase